MTLSATFRTIAVLSLAGVAFAAPPSNARPGTLNYSEGQVTLDGRAVTRNSLGSTEVEPGQVLRTNQGKVEMLLTPGVFVRLADHSAIRMVSPSLTDTRVELVSGEAMVEADQILHGNHLVVADHGVDTQILKNGIYQFRSEPAQVAVYDGQAEVFANDRQTKVGKGKEMLLADAAEGRSQSFDRHQTDALYQWSSVRSEYLSEANQASVRTIVAGYPGWYGPGWFWNPYFSTWAFVPGDGFFASPFGYGYGFYSPLYWRTYPRYYARPNAAIRTAPAVRAPAMRAPAAMGRRR